MNKQVFCKFEIEWENSKNNQDYIGVFSIPRNKKELFLTDPKLVFKSLDAHCLYYGFLSEYTQNKGFHDIQIEKNFFIYTSYMLKLMGS